MLYLYLKFVFKCQTDISICLDGSHFWTDFISLQCTVLEHEPDAAKTSLTRAGLNPE
jgi:hypothetical protein